MSVLRIAALDASLFPKWAALFTRAHSACHCRYWHFAGTKNDWLARCAHEPQVNCSEQEAAVARHDGTADGLVALARSDGDGDGETVVGWMKIGARATLAKLRNQSVYRAHSLGSDDGVWSIGCILVDPAHRRSGVARALLDAAPAFARARGGTALEAYPRESAVPLYDEEAWMGPASLYVACGFVPVAGESPYRVMRKSLG